MAVLAPAGRVGIVALAALLILGSMWVFFSKNAVGTKYYYLDVLFADATGAAKGVNVTLAGKTIGTVDSFELEKSTYRAKLHLKIDQRFPIPVGSTFSVITPLLGSQGIVAVTPPPPAKINGIYYANGTVINGTPTLDINAALGQTGELIKSVTQTTKKVNRLLDQSAALLNDPKMKQMIDSTLTNVQTASANGNQITQKLNRDLDANNRELQRILQDTGRSSKVIFSNLGDTTAEVKDITHSNRAKIEDILTNLQDTTSAVAGLTDQLNQALNSGGVAKNLTGTVANLKTVTDKLVLMTNDLQQFTGDPQLRGDLKKTIHNIEATTEQSTFLLERLNRLAGGRHGSSNQNPTTPVSGANSAPVVQANDNSLPLFLPRIGFTQDLTHRRFRADFDTIIPLGPQLEQFGTFGLYNVGDSARLNLQYGRKLGKSSNIDGRVGLHRSKLGAGLDLGLNDPFSLQFDAYDPNRLTLDARGVFMLNKTTGISAGIESFNHKPGVTVGVEIRP